MSHYPYPPSDNPELQALWNAWIDADIECRETEARVLAENPQFKAAESARDESWLKYMAARNAYFDEKTPRP